MSWWSERQDRDASDFLPTTMNSLLLEEKPNAEINVS